MSFKNFNTFVSQVSPNASAGEDQTEPGTDGAQPATDAIPVQQVAAAKSELPSPGGLPREKPAGSHAGSQQRAPIAIQAVRDPTNRALPIPAQKVSPPATNAAAVVRGLAIATQATASTPAVQAAPGTQGPMLSFPGGLHEIRIHESDDINQIPTIPKRKIALRRLIDRANASHIWGSPTVPICQHCHGHQYTELVFDDHSKFHCFTCKMRVEEWPESCTKS